MLTWRVMVLVKQKNRCGSGLQTPASAFPYTGGTHESYRKVSSVVVDGRRGVRRRSVYWDSSGDAGAGGGKARAERNCAG
jgi:hypothetical protein